MTSLRRRLAILVAALLLPLGAVLAVPSPARAAGPLGLTSLSFPAGTVNVTDRAKVVPLTWTVTDSDPAAEQVQGTVEIRMQGSAPGTYVGQTYEVGFRLGENAYEGATFVSGTVARSTYRYDFLVPRYAAGGHSTWLVTKVSIQDTAGNALTVEGSALNRYPRDLKVRTLVDREGPGVQFVQLDEPYSPEGFYRYVGDGPARVPYYVALVDTGAGVWKGTARMTGPGGQSATAAFEAVWFRPDKRCGSITGGDVNQPSCTFVIEIPAGAASGTWQLTSLTLVDNAGNTRTVPLTDTDSPPVQVTSNEVVSVDDLTATPNPVNNWQGSVEVPVSMNVDGAVGGVAAVHLTFASGTCFARPDSLVVGSGTATVTVYVGQGTEECVVSGLAVVDGAGNVAAYGSRHGGPDPGLTIRRLPNTTPPTVVEASLSPTTIPASEAPFTNVVIRLLVDAPIAPVDGYEMIRYASDGTEVGSALGGISADADGVVTIYASLPWEIVPDTYHFGIRIQDASGLSTAYGMPGAPPFPGGPLEITVTEG